MNIAKNCQIHQVDFALKNLIKKFVKIVKSINIHSVSWNFVNLQFLSLHTFWTQVKWVFHRIMAYILKNGTYKSFHTVVWKCDQTYF